MAKPIGRNRAFRKVALRVGVRKVFPFDLIPAGMWEAKPPVKGCMFEGRWRLLRAKRLCSLP